jgi:hypothetical protein
MRGSGGVETNLEEWFGSISEEVLAISEDKPVNRNKAS